MLRVIHSAAIVSPARASSATHCINSSRRVLIVGMSEALGYFRGMIVVGNDSKKTTWKVGTSKVSARSILECRLRGISVSETRTDDMRVRF